MSAVPISKTIQVVFQLWRISVSLIAISALFFFFPLESSSIKFVKVHDSEDQPGFCLTYQKKM